MDGLLIVNKPKGRTSFDIIRDIRKEYNIKAVGHIGTLDPEASGVLPILIGKATKLSDILMLHDKEYIAEITLGIKTDTGDGEGKVIEESNLKYYDISQIENTLNSFKGHSKQIPPMYSAIKINGRKLYEIARMGKEVDRNSRDIFIEDIKLLNYSNNVIQYKVICSKGTYIRVLSEDIAEKLGTIGYMSSLQRTRVGDYKIEDSNKFIEMKDILDIDFVEISNDDYNKLLNGILINIKNYDDGLIKIYNNNEFKGFGIVKNSLLKRKIILD